MHIDMNKIEQMVQLFIKLNTDSQEKLMKKGYELLFTQKSKEELIESKEIKILGNGMLAKSDEQKIYQKTNKKIEHMENILELIDTDDMHKEKATLIALMDLLYQHGGKDRNFFVFFKDNWKSIFINWNQLSVVALVIGTALHAAGIPRPAAGTTIFQALIHVSAWVALIPVGYLIDFSHFKDYARQTLDLIPIKMVLTPLASYFLALCFTSDPVLLGTIVIVMATPCAINALITERLYDLNVNLAMAPFITTQLLYILILYPAFYLLVSWGYLPFK